MITEGQKAITIFEGVNSNKGLLIHYMRCIVILFLYAHLKQSDFASYHQLKENFREHLEAVNIPP